MAEAAAIGSLGVAASVASKWIGPTAFAARHEESHRKEMDQLQKSTDRWYKEISDQEVNSDEELEFQNLQREYVLKETILLISYLLTISSGQSPNERRGSIYDYKHASVFDPFRKFEKRYKVRTRKREASRLVHSLEDIVHVHFYSSQGQST